MIGERKRETYGGAICRRNEQKSLPDIFRACVFAVGRTADRSFQFWLVKNLTGDFTRNNSEHTRGEKNKKLRREIL